MPYTLIETSIQKEISKVVKEQKNFSIDIIDIVDKIIINVDKHEIEINYILGSYIRDEQGNIETISTPEGDKKRAYILERKNLKIGESYYSEIASKIINNQMLGKAIEETALSYIKQFDEQLKNIPSENIQLVNSEEINVVFEPFMPFIH